MLHSVMVLVDVTTQTPIT